MKALFNRDTAISVGFFVLLGLAWEFGVRWSGVQSYLLPPPSAIAAELWQSRGPILSQSLVTLTEVFWGFIIAVVLGVPIAALIYFSPTAKRTVYPLFVALQSIPKIGLAPLIVVWFGYGLTSKLIMAFLFAFFPIIISTLGGLASTPAHLEEHFRALRATPLQTFWRLRLPAALPSFLDGCKVAMPLAVIGAIVGEFVGSEHGLGHLILDTTANARTDYLFAALVMVSIVAALLYLVVELIAQRVWWRGL